MPDRAAGDHTPIHMIRIVKNLLSAMEIIARIGSEVLMNALTKTPTTKEDQ